MDSDSDTTNSDNSKFVRKLSDELALQIAPLEPPHFTPTSRTWIDVLLIDSNDTLLNIDILRPFWTTKLVKCHHIF